MAVRLNSKTDRIVHSWAGGSTEEVLLLPEGSTWENKNFKIRVSSAVCFGGSSLFSDFTGFTRHISPRKGLLQMEHVLQSGEKKSVHLEPYEIDIFQGAWKTTSEGAYEDFNLLTDNSFSGAVQAVKGSTEFSFDPKKQYLAGFFCTADTVFHCSGVSLEGSFSLREGDFLYFLSEDTDTAESASISPRKPDAPCGYWITVRHRN